MTRALIEDDNVNIDNKKDKEAYLAHVYAHIGHVGIPTSRSVRTALAVLLRETSIVDGIAR